MDEDIRDSRSMPSTPGEPPGGRRDYTDPARPGYDPPHVQVLGIVNVTRDSFSDGGQYLDPAAAVAHARQLVADGADYVDVGAESTHPDAEDVLAEEEIRRLHPVVSALLDAGVRVSVDTHKPAVMREMLSLGVHMINDVAALRGPEAVEAVRAAKVPIILMHSTAGRARAAPQPVEPAQIVERIRAFFEDRIAALEAAGIERHRLILDPGMGYFLSTDPAVSMVVLRNIETLRALGPPLCISVSRKSFLGALLGKGPAPRPILERAAGTLAAELWACSAGAAYIRTHDVRALRDALRIWQAIAESPRSE